jgi:hypothetical protein
MGSSDLAAARGGMDGWFGQLLSERCGASRAALVTVLDGYQRLRDGCQALAERHADLEGMADLRRRGAGGTDRDQALTSGTSSVRPTSGI